MDLQKGPLGILGWFSLKVTGRNPPGFGDSVVPVVEVGDNYLATSELQISNSPLATSLAAFNSVTFTVPNGKVWRLIAGSLFGSLDAADAALVSQQTIKIVSPNSSPQGVRLAVNQFPAWTGPRTVAATFRPPIFLPSGWKVVFELSTSAAITVTSNLQATVLFQEMDL